MTDTIIDDQDLSSVHYNGTWIRGGSAHEHDQTVASSTRVGDSFTVSFYGNSISVYGTIDSTSGGVLTNYSVDGAPPEQSTSQPGTGDTFNQQFWKSPALDVGQHQLLVTMIKINDDPQPGEGTIWFDYFLVRDRTIRPPSSKKLRTREIVGGVIGSVLGLLITLAVFLILLKRHKEKRRKIQAQPFLPSKNGGEMHSQTNFHVGGIAMSDTNVGPISPFPFKQTQENNGTMPAPGIINTQPNGDLPRKSTLIDSLRERSQVSDRAYASTPPSATIPSSETPSSEDYAGSQTQDAASASAPAALSAAGKHQRTGSSLRPHLTIPMSMDGDVHGPLHSGLSTSSTQIVGPTPISESPLQHIDSGMRSINVQTDLPTPRVELPPIYTPV